MNYVSLQARWPRYREVADDIREAILCKQTLVNVALADGAQLPTEPELGG